MAQLLYDNILFSNVNKWITDASGEYSYTGILIASKLNQKNGQGYKLLDAIDIDWNNAWVRSLNAYINNTEDLLNVLNQLNKEDNLEEIDKNLESVWKQLNEITLSYITHASLHEILSTSYQSKLIPGDFIKIDNETNIITTYDLASYAYLTHNYTSLTEHYNLINSIKDNYYTKNTVLDLIQQYVKEGIDKVIDGADSAFDTLKEISDWILEQNRYIPVEPQEVIDNFKPDTYFWFDETTGKYVAVTEPGEVVTDGSIQYYRLENYFTDIKNLIEDVDKLQETVGSYQQNVIYNPSSNTYTYLNSYSYTGILGDIEDLKVVDTMISQQVEAMQNQVNSAVNIANDAYEYAIIAYNTGNIAYDTAILSYNLTLESIDIANEAYTVAKKASEDVGIPSFIGRGWTYIETINDVNSYIETGYTVYYYYNGNYILASSPYSEDFDYYFYEESITGTGLTKRVENVELDVNILQIELENTTKLANESLYRLHVDNSLSSYVSLGLTPDMYNGDNHRTLHIETTEAVINSESGEIESHGLATITTLYDFYSYISSWQILEDIK